MKFITPIIQGTIVLLAISLLGGGIKVYGQIEAFKTRLQTVEESVKAITAKLDAVPLCRKSRTHDPQ